MMPIGPSSGPDAAGRIPPSREVLPVRPAPNRSAPAAPGSISRRDGAASILRDLARATADQQTGIMQARLGLDRLDEVERGLREGDASAAGRAALDPASPFDADLRAALPPGLEDAGRALEVIGEQRVRLEDRIAQGMRQVAALDVERANRAAVSTIDDANVGTVAAGLREIDVTALDPGRVLQLIEG